jgi:hypothetical protein
MTLNDLWTHAFRCDQLLRRGERPILDESAWTILRTAYRTVAFADEAESAAATPAAGAHGAVSRTASRTGFRTAVSARPTPDGKGRGVFADGPIRRGELVWSPVPHTARFSTGAAFRAFLSLLPPDLACDVLQWAYVQDVADERRRPDPTAPTGEVDGLDPTGSRPAHGAGRTLRISVDLDEGSYMNGEEDDPNIGCRFDSAEQAIGGAGVSCLQFVALRDISAGEELLCSYGEFAWSDGWSDFGM